MYTVSHHRLYGHFSLPAVYTSAVGHCLWDLWMSHTQYHISAMQL